MKIDLCRYLRWKGHRDDLDGDDLAFVLIHNHVQYQCLHTCQPWGTDGDVAAPETCTGDRPCWTGRTLETSAALADALAAGPDHSEQAATRVKVQPIADSGSSAQIVALRLPSRFEE
ncbi:hypothetical protein ACNOYE_28160 [Nannocystaceae bacterium ST9]